MQSISHFIDVLAQTEPNANSFNPYRANDDPNNAIRRENLRRYLMHIADRQPITLMVMEAPGYRGCRLTGIPVTSRRVMLEGVPELALFGTERGYRDTDDIGFENIKGEQSATIVWETLASLRHTPIIWNTYPFHPMKDKPRSNRKPLTAEVELGVNFLHFIIGYYTPQVIIAVGNVAEATLIGMGTNCVKVRHPAQGGKADFVAGLTSLLT
jgi:uracil-DNA glycosylase